MYWFHQYPQALLMILLIFCRYFKTVQLSLQSENGKMTAAELIACFREFGFKLICFMLWALLLKILHIFSANPLNITPKTKNVLDYAVIDSYRMLAFTMRSNKVCVKDIYIHDKFDWYYARRATSKGCNKDERIGSRGKSSSTCFAGNPQPLATQNCSYKCPRT
jgi:hypothetical protein